VLRVRALCAEGTTFVNMSSTPWRAQGLLPQVVRNCRTHTVLVRGHVSDVDNGGACA